MMRKLAVAKKLQQEVISNLSMGKQHPDHSSPSTKNTETELSYFWPPLAQGLPQQSHWRECSSDETATSEVIVAIHPSMCHFVTSIVRKPSDCHEVEE
jgi:hypothetical protein